MLNAPQWCERNIALSSAPVFFFLGASHVAEGLNIFFCMWLDIIFCVLKLTDISDVIKRNRMPPVNCILIQIEIQCHVILM